ncbi:MAG: CBS domain-containing protein [Xenococcaceae cyanobacterium]
MDLILCHQTVDFDALGAAVGLTKLYQGSKIVLTGGAHPGVKDFLALHRDEFALLEMRSVDPDKIRSLLVVDTQKRDRLGKASQWFDLPNLSSIALYDHHIDAEADICATETQIEAVGATTTLIVELLERENIQPNPFEATVMALGIHVDTGSLTFDQTTARDARALAWLMEKNANIKTIFEYVEPSLSPQLQKLLKQALEKIQKTQIRGYTIATILLETEKFVPGLSSLTERIINLTETDALLLAHQYEREPESNRSKLTVIGRSRIDECDLNRLLEQFGGGGHAQAASVSMKDVDAEQTLAFFLQQLIAQIPHPPIALDLMSSPVRTIRPDTTIEQAQRILLRYGHSGLSVVDDRDRLVGIISRRDLDLALHHGFSHAPVKGYMSKNLRTIAPDTSLPEIEDLMVTYDVGRLPVLENDKLMGIVTRTDVLRQLHRDREHQKELNGDKLPLTACLLPSMRSRLAAPMWELLDRAANAAKEKGWHLYLVGGAVRDLLLSETENEPLLLQDIDMVVDGFHRAADNGAGVELASTLQQIYPQARLEIHGAFQTAALLWHKDEQFGSLWVDIATARTEFYPYPAANPEVEASSIRQDLYRRDFTINALAVRLTPPREGELLDFFGGLLDLRSRQIRVLHANSFIEDPTRIYRAVRFAVKLQFELEAQTEEYIRYAIASGVYERLRLENRQAPALTTRLRAELQYILEARYWQRALKLLAKLDALHCLHPQLQLTDALWWQIRCISHWLYWLDREEKFERYLMRLEVLIASLKPEIRGKVATNLQLPKDSIELLDKLDILETQLNEHLPHCQLKSDIVKLLRNYKTADLILFAVRSNRKIRGIIWQYVTDWSQIKPFLNGNDLKSLGYKPGQQFKQILEDLLIATLDGKICDRTEAEAFLQERDFDRL